MENFNWLKPTLTEILIASNFEKQSVCQEVNYSLLLSEIPFKTNHNWFHSVLVCES